MQFIINFIKYIIVYFILSLFTTNLIADNVEWDSVEGAVSYEFQVVDSGGKTVQENKGLTETKVSLNEFPVGKYKYRIGVVDKKGNIVKGDWVELIVDDNTYKKDGKEYPVHLEWEKVLDAKHYFVQVLTSSEKLVKAFKTKETFKDLMLPVGKYKFKTAIEKNGKKIWSEWKEFEVKAPEIPSIRKNVLWRSFVFPGWGQLYRKDPVWRALIYPVLMIPLSIRYGNLYSQNNSAKRNYDKTVQNIFLLQAEKNNFTTTLSILSNLQTESFKNEINTTDSQAGSVSFALAAVYLINLIDAYFLYDYNSSGHEVDKTPKLSLQYHTPFHINTGTRESVYSLTYQWSF